MISKRVIKSMKENMSCSSDGSLCTQKWSKVNFEIWVKAKTVKYSQKYVKMGLASIYVNPNGYVFHKLTITIK